MKLFKKKIKYNIPEPEIKTPAEIVDTLITMHKMNIREIAFDWRDIALGKVSKRKLLKVCRAYGKVRYKWHGFSVRFS